MFESYRDGNWEIYTSRGDGTEQARVTTNSYPDLRPRLNADGTRVLFQSKRGDLWDLFAMNADGTDEVRLTQTAGNNRSPYWTPNGRIVFASDRDGNPEIYIMNGDGTGVHRLTNNPSADLTPSVSPDGTQIVWARQDGTTSNMALWVMSLDGSDARALTPTILWAQDPVFAPDSTRIAFDADADGDGALDLLVWDGSQVYTLWDGGSDMLDGRMGAWLSTGDFIFFSEIQHVLYEDQLYIQSASVHRIALTPGSFPEPILTSGYNLNPDARSMDLQPPIAHFSVPRYVKSVDGYVDLRWSGEDVGPSGISGFDVQAFEGGQWSYYCQDCAVLGFRYPGTCGETKAWRVRARDNAGNYGPWAGGPDMLMSIYSWSGSGQVLDVRERPVPLATLSSGEDSIPVLSSTADSAGNFTAHFCPASDGFLSAGHAGYEPSTFKADPEATDLTGMRLFLGPTDDVIVNGGFETGDLSGWLANGATVSGLPEAGASGAAGAQVGFKHSLDTHDDPSSSSWGQSDRDSSWGESALDSAGTLHMAYSRVFTASIGVAYASLNAAGVWTDPVLISQSADPEGDAAIATDSHNGVHVVWVYQNGPYFRDLVYRYKPSGGVWTPEFHIPGGTASAETKPHLVMDSHDTLYLLWDRQPSPGDSQVVMATKPWGQGWGVPVVVPTRPIPGNRPISLVIDPSDLLHAVWYEGGSIYPRRLVYSRKAPSSGWTDAIPLVTEGTDGALGVPVLAFGGGRLVFTWQQTLYRYIVPSFDYKLFVRSSDDGGITWSAPRHVIQALASREHRTAGMGVDDQGHIHLLVTRSADPLGDTAYMHSEDAGATWSEPVRVSSERPFERVIIHNARNALLGTFGGMFSFLPALHEETTDYSLSHTTVVSPSLHAPTLSFQTRLVKTAVTHEDMLRVLLNGSLVYTATAQQDAFTHTWVDMSPWAGQTVTVTFQLHTVAGGARSWAYVDDASLGSWMTPVVERVEPAVIVADTPVVLTVKGHNFSDAPYVRVGPVAGAAIQHVDDTTLLVTLPEGLPSGRHVVWVINVHGQEGLLNNAVTTSTIAPRLWLPVIIR